MSEDDSLFQYTLLGIAYREIQFVLSPYTTPFTHLYFPCMMNTFDHSAVQYGL